MMTGVSVMVYQNDDTSPSNDMDNSKSIRDITKTDITSTVVILLGFVVFAIALSVAS